MPRHVTAGLSNLFPPSSRPFLVPTLITSLYPDSDRKLSGYKYMPESANHCTLPCQSAETRSLAGISGHRSIVYTTY